MGRSRLDSETKSDQISGQVRPWLGPHHRRAILTLFWAGLVVWVVLAWVFKVPIEPDEGQHLIGGRYMLLDLSYTIRILRFVGGYPDWTAEARSFYTFPPVWDGFLAISIGAFGIGAFAHGLWLVVAMTMMIVSAYSVARRLFDSDTALIAVTLLVWSRAGFRDGQLLEAEPQVAAFGMGAFACVVVGTQLGKLRWFVLAGACLGVALLMKLWLALPAALLVTGSLCYSLWMGKKVGTTVLRWFLLALTTLAVGLLHLAWVAVIAPDDLGTWVHVYLKPVVERFADESDALSKPWWFYGAVIYRDFVFVGGLLVAYVVALRGGHTWTLFGRILGATAVFATLAMSLFGKKESLYLYPLVPIWCLCAAVGARWLFDVGKPGSDKRTGLRWMAGFWGVGMLTVGAVLAWLSFLGKSPSGALSTSFGAGHIVVCSILGVGLIVWSLVGTWPISTAVWVVIAAHLLWGGLMAGQRVADYRNNTSRALAQFFGAPQDAVPPGPETMTPRYVSAWSGIHGYWLWKKGRPWYYDDERDLSFEELQKRFGNEILFYEIDRSFKGTLGGPPTEQHHRMILGWLVSQTVEITEEIESHTGLGLSTRVFVPKK